MIQFCQVSQHRHFRLSICTASEALSTSAHFSPDRTGPLAVATSLIPSHRVTWAIRESSTSRSSSHQAHRASHSGLHCDFAETICYHKLIDSLTLPE